MTPMKPAHPFVLIRHGQTDWNAEGRFQGQQDIPINATGAEQARANGLLLAKVLPDWRSYAFVASPFGRTRQTMEHILTVLGADPTGYSLDDRLKEVTFGDWEKRTLDEVAADEPEGVAARDDDKWNFVPPRGESYAMAAVRVRPVLEELNRPTVFVTHGGIIRAMRHLLEGLDGETASKGDTPQDRLYRYADGAGTWIPPFDA